MTRLLDHHTTVLGYAVNKMTAIEVLLKRSVKSEHVTLTMAFARDVVSRDITIAYTPDLNMPIRRLVFWDHRVTFVESEAFEEHGSLRTRAGP